MLTANPDTSVKEIAPTGGIRFTVASRPQARYSNAQSVSNLLSSTSFQPIQLPATGFVRKLCLAFTVTGTAASAGAVVAGDGPWNLIAGITVTDATGQPIMQPISGFNLRCVNKYLPSGTVKANNPLPFYDPMLGPEYQFSSTATNFTAQFRLDVDFEQDENTGYGSIPNLDANASLQLKIDLNPYTVAFSGTTVSAANVALRVTQHYWAPVGSTVGGVPAQTTPIGFGDYVETRYETQTVTASSENTVSVTNRGGLIKGMIVVSRAAGTRTAFTPQSNVGIVLDNNPIYEGVPLEEWYAMLRAAYGYIGTDLTTSYAPLTAGTLPGLDRGVLPIPFWLLSGGRDSWLSTRVGSLFQVKLTPGASATGLEIITQIAQVKDAASFYASSSLV